MLKIRCLSLTKEALGGTADFWEREFQVQNSVLRKWFLLLWQFAREEGAYLHNSVTVVNNDAFVYVFYFYQKCFYSDLEHSYEVAFIIHTLNKGKWRHRELSNWVSSVLCNYLMAGLGIKYPFCYTSAVSIECLDKNCCRIGEGKNRADCSFLLIRTNLKYWHKTN